MVFSVDVEVSSHDLLRAGVVAARVRGSQRTWHRVVVDAGTPEDAVLVAAQMAAATCGMPTATYLRE